MGDWTLIVEGAGPHHNANIGDVDVIVAQMFEALKNNGHQIKHASFVLGEAESLKGAEVIGDAFPDRWRKYAAYAVSCAKSGELPTDIDAFEAQCVLQDDKKLPWDRVAPT